jgi:hypothetical protein
MTQISDDLADRPQCEKKSDESGGDERGDIDSADKSQFQSEIDEAGGDTSGDDIDGESDSADRHENQQTVNTSPRQDALDAEAETEKTLRDKFRYKQTAHEQLDVLIGYHDGNVHHGIHGRGRPVRPCNVKWLVDQPKECVLDKFRDLKVIKSKKNQYQEGISLLQNLKLTVETSPPSQVNMSDKQEAPSVADSEIDVAMAESYNSGYETSTDDNQVGEGSSSGGTAWSTRTSGDCQTLPVAAGTVPSSVHVTPQEKWRRDVSQPSARETWQLSIEQNSPEVKPQEEWGRDVSKPSARAGSTGTPAPSQFIVDATYLVESIFRMTKDHVMAERLGQHVFSQFPK